MVCLPFVSLSLFQAYGSHIMGGPFISPHVIDHRPQESARPYFTRPVSLCLVKGWRCFSALGNSYFRHGRYQKRVLAKLNPLNEQHFFDQRSEVCRNSRFRPFPGKEASDSCARNLKVDSFHPLPVLDFVISIVKTFRVIPGLPKDVLH